MPWREEVFLPVSVAMLAASADVNGERCAVKCCLCELQQSRVGGLKADLGKLLTGGLQVVC